ncbi:MAG: ADP-ribosyltransferase [Oligoflexales bacterium]
MKLINVIVIWSFFEVSQMACKRRADRSSATKQAEQVGGVSGKITNVSCKDFGDAYLKNSCIIDLTNEQGEVLKLVSDDFAALTKEVRSDLLNRPLAVFNDLVLSFEDESVLETLRRGEGTGNFFRFLGDLPWLCFNKLAPSAKCGVSFPLDFEAPGDLLKQAEERVKPRPYMEEIMKPYPKLGIIEASAIASYTIALFDYVNPALRSNDPQLLQEWYPTIAAITSGLRKVTSYEGLVYRGAKLSEERVDPYVDAFNSREPIQERAFLSTSYEEEGSFKKAVRFLIRSHSAAKISAFSRYENEKEALFAPGTWFRVTGIYDGKDEETEQDYTMIEMSELVIIK